MCWECYSCVICDQNAIDVRGYADFAPMGHKVRVRREEKGVISWKINLEMEQLKLAPITTKPWGQFIPKVAEENTPSQKDLILKHYNEPKYLKLGEFRKAVNEDGILTEIKRHLSRGYTTNGEKNTLRRLRYTCCWRRNGRNRRCV